MHVLDSNLQMYNSMLETGYTIYIKSEMKVINLMHAFNHLDKPITGSFKHTSNASQLETINPNGAFECSCQDRFFYLAYN